MKSDHETMQLVKRRWALRAPARTRAAEAGMTLLEIMIVLALIGLVMGAIGVGAEQLVQEGADQDGQDRRRVRSPAGRPAVHDGEQQQLPGQLDDLVSNKNMTKSRRRIPGARTSRIKCPGTGDPDGVDVISSGPDKQEGTADDIKSWERAERRARRAGVSQAASRRPVPHAGRA